MHISILDQNEFIVYLNANKIDGIDFGNYNEIENYFHNLFLTLKNNYNIDVHGYYNIKMYKDKNNGIVLEIKEDVDYINVFDNQIEMNIEIKESDFIYDVDDYFFLNDINNISIYTYKNKIYIFLDNKIEEKEFLKLMEFGKLIYGNDAKKILNNGKKIII